MEFSRRWFIGGAASFGAFGGCRFFSSNDYRAGGRPNVTFGVVSDVHISTFKGRANYVSNCATLRHTLEWYRDQGVDAVMMAGDLADNGLVGQLQALADTWYAVFPNDRAPDGRKVEKVFVYGNHDWEGQKYGTYAKKAFPDEAEFKRQVLVTDYSGNWERIFHEEYKRVYAKQINGYTFIGQHWDERGKDARYDFSPLGGFLTENKGLVDPSLPFFYTQHPHPRNTCYGPWAWGRDNGDVTQILSAHPNAIAFSGHSHYSLTDERSVWQGAFTSVGTSSLRYTGEPYNEFAGGFENTTCEGKEALRQDAAKVMTTMPMSDCRQGMLWRVYDDCIVVRRREFVSDLDVGDDWVMPLPAAESKPFAFAARARKFNAPVFPSGAALAVDKVRAKTRGAKSRYNAKLDFPSQEVDALELTFPAVVADKQARVYHYEVTLAAGGKQSSHRVLAQGFNHAVTHPKATQPVICRVPALAESGEVTEVRVTPVNFFGKRGNPLTARV